MKKVYALCLVVVAMLISAQGYANAEAPDLEKNAFCEKYSDYLIRMGGAKATIQLGIERDRDIASECKDEISEAVEALKVNKESFVISDDRVTLYARNEPLMSLAPSQIAYVGGVFRVSDISVYLVEIGVKTNRRGSAYFSIYTSLNDALEAREKIADVVRSAIPEDTALAF